MNQEQIRLNYDLARKVDGLTAENAVEAMASDGITLDEIIGAFQNTQAAPLEAGADYLRELQLLKSTSGG